MNAPISALGDPLLTAALDYARRGFQVFPCSPHNKAPLPKKDTDPDTGDEIPNTGGLRKATTDPDQIRQWWTAWPNAMIGVAAGPRSGFWAIDPDAPKQPGDADGRRELAQLQIKHGKLPPTHSHLTPGGGKHILFRWRGDKPITNREGALKKSGINVRGDGGYLIFPPSKSSNGKSYEIEEALDCFNFAEAPEWLYDLILTRPEPVTISERAMATVRRPERASTAHQSTISSQFPRAPHRQAYAEAALRGEIDKLTGELRGGRNIQLNNSSVSLATLVASGDLNEQQVIDELLSACSANGLMQDDGYPSCIATIRSGFNYGLQHPRKIEDRPDYTRHPPRMDHPSKGTASASASATSAPAPAPAPADPVDLWAKFDPPSLPRNVLPDVIERFAVDQGRTMGADISGIAVGALAVCAAAIPDKIQLQVKRHNIGWLESARLWVALVGPPSTMKSPVMGAVVRPLRRIDSDMARRNADERSKYEKLPADERKQTDPPKQTRLLLQDTTIEAAQEIIKDSPDGMLCYQDELSGWFGSMDKYSGARGSAKDRAFWLEAYNGSPYSINRVGRGSIFIENLSISMLGGIQPEPLRKLAEDSADDGLLQRLIPIILQPAVVGTDEPTSDEVSEYAALVGRLHNIENPFFGSGIRATTLKFDDGAQDIRRELERKHLELQSCEIINRKLGAHIGKYNGMFARLCITWHCIEHAHQPLPVTIGEATARRVATFLHSFLLPHALAFYAGVLGLSNDHDRLTAVAGYILAHGLEKITNRDIQRGDATMRRLERRDIDSIFDQLDAFGWITKTPGPRPTDPPHWIVNPAVHEKFAARASSELERRKTERAMIAGLMPREK